MIVLPVTSTSAALSAILMFPLTLQISMRRASLGVAKGDITAFVFGHGGDDVLRRRIRAFGNFGEYVPMSLLLLALTEFAGGPRTLLWSLGALLVAGRVLHAAGMLYADSPAPRGVAMLMTYATFLVPAGWLLLHYWA